jgi:hypothetical protein
MVRWRESVNVIDHKRGDGCEQAFIIIRTAAHFAEYDRRRPCPPA